MVMMNQLVELPSHLVTVRLAAPMAVEITNAEATTVDRKHRTTNQPSDTFCVLSGHITGRAKRSQVFVIPGCAVRRRPGIHFSRRFLPLHGFRARSLTRTPE